jgi:hypothetical protein
MDDLEHSSVSRNKCSMYGVKEMVSLGIIVFLQNKQAGWIKFDCEKTRQLVLMRLDSQASKLDFLYSTISIYLQ